ncbi:hypothetical protein JTB14_020540 [Gonioctena quinquepunctata]|nr:hypothetical protein JTB14_020540 [Gonioctena quinquepunctata]
MRLKNMLQQMKSAKAPGLDIIPLEAFKILEEIAHETILDPLNSVLSGKQFSKEWKKAKLVLIPRDKPEDMKLRPICLLNSISKDFEERISQETIPRL